MKLILIKDKILCRDTFTVQQYQNCVSAFQQNSDSPVQKPFKVTLGNNFVYCDKDKNHINILCAKFFP
jgi:hypothetical protein